MDGIIVHTSGPVIPVQRNISVSGPEYGNAGRIFHRIFFLSKLS